jgi:hypothetical protein
MVEVAEADPAAEAEPVRTAVVAARGGEELGTTAQRQGVRPAGQQAEGGGGPVRHYPEKLAICSGSHLEPSPPASAARVVVDADSGRPARSVLPLRRAGGNSRALSRSYANGEQPSG